MSHKVGAGILLAGIALALGACGEKAPQGQVVATVNGQEVTLQEVNTELQGAQLPPNMAKEEAQRIALQRVIDRKLLAAEARERGLDKTPDYIAQQVKLDETLLAQQLVRQQANQIGQPTQAELAAFRNENPNVFTQRQQLQVDQIRLQPPRDASVLKSLETVHTQDGVASTLQSKGVEFQRGRSVIDTAVLPPDVVKKIEELPAGEPFVLPARGMITINTVVGRQAVPLPEPQAAQLATNGWKEKKFTTTMAERLDALKKAAKIDYQSGFGPPANGAGKPVIPGAPAAAPGAAPAASPAG